MICERQKERMYKGMRSLLSEGYTLSAKYEVEYKIVLYFRHTRNGNKMRLDVYDNVISYYKNGKFIKSIS